MGAKLRIRWVNVIAFIFVVAFTFVVVIAAIFNVDEALGNHIDKPVDTSVVLGGI